MKKNLGLFSLVMAAILGLSPALAFAHDNENRGSMMKIESRSKVDLKLSNKDDNDRKIGMMPGMMKPALLGVVSSIGSSSTLTVNGKLGFGRNDAATSSFTVNASGAKVIKNNATSTLGSIAVGDTVAIQGTVNGNVVAATVIRAGIVIGGNGPISQKGDDKKDKPKMPPIVVGNGQPIVAGSVTLVGSTSLTITNKSNVTYNIDATNAKIVVGNATSTLSNIKVGDTVVVQGTINSNSIVASSIIDQKMPQAKPGNSDHEKEKSKPGFFGGIGLFFSHMFGF